MAYDLIIKNGMVVDGSGFSRYRADVAIKDGTIVEMGRIRGAAAASIDADGLFVAPGIIDLHTHYDAQPFWDKLCTSSVWHGVTTVLTGNCGLTLAPLRPEHREAMLATFCCVEDLPVKSLAAVLRWSWETFGEYMDAIDQGLGVNMMPLVGHNPLRLGAMGKAAWERAATADEITTMQDLLRAAGVLSGLRCRHAELRGRSGPGRGATLRPAAGHSLQSAVHAEEDDLLQQSRRLGRRDGPARPGAVGRPGRSREAPGAA